MSELEKHVEWVVVCHPLDLNQTIFIKSLLQSEEIPFVVEGETLNSLYAPLRPIPMRVRVPAPYAGRASELLNDL